MTMRFTISGHKLTQYLIQDGVRRVCRHPGGDMEQHLERERGYVGRADAAAAAAAQPAREPDVAL